MDVDDAPISPVRDRGDGVRVEVIAEEAHFGKRQIETDNATIRLTTATSTVTVTGEVTRGELRIERSTVDRAVDAAPLPREENGVLTYFVVEERAVIVKQLFVVEEVRVTRAETIHPIELSTTVRQQRATVEHRSPASTGETNG